MSKVKSPREKKRLAYDRDHVSPAEYSHGFRKTWPRKEAKAQRAARRKARQLLRATADDAALATVRRKKVGKWAAISLRENVKSKLRKRPEMVGAHKARRARDSLLRLGTQRLGEPSLAIVVRVHRIKDLCRLEELCTRVSSARSWQDLFGRKQ